jgi:hypothetical protein
MISQSSNLLLLLKFFIFYFFYKVINTFNPIATIAPLLVFLVDYYVRISRFSSFRPGSHDSLAKVAQPLLIVYLNTGVPVRSIPL